MRGGSKASAGGGGVREGGAAPRDLREGKALKDYLRLLQLSRRQTDRRWWLEAGRDREMMRSSQIPDAFGRRSPKDLQKKKKGTEYGM